MCERKAKVCGFVHNLRQSGIKPRGEMSKSEDHPSRLTEKETFVIFDTIKKHGKPQEAREAIRKQLQPVQLPHRKTVTAVFNVGVELFNRGPNARNVLTTQEADDIAEKACYGVSRTRVVELHRLYQLWRGWGDYDFGITKQQEVLLGSAYWRGPLKPDGVEDVSLVPLLPPGSAPEESRSPEEREARLLDEARTRERSRELRRRAFGI